MTDQPFKLTSFMSNEIVQVSAGWHSSLFLNKDGICFKTTPKGVNQQIDQVSEVTEVCAGRFTSSLVSNGCLYLLQGSQAIKIETTVTKIIKVSIGKSMACALDEKGFVWTWGENAEGELGLGDTVKRELPAPVLQLKGRNISGIACGGRSVICLGQQSSKKDSSKSAQRAVSSTKHSNQLLSTAQLDLNMKRVID